VILQNLCQKL